MYVPDLLGLSGVIGIPYGGTKQLHCEPGAFVINALAKCPLPFALHHAPRGAVRRHTEGAGCAFGNNCKKWAGTPEIVCKDARCAVPGQRAHRCETGIFPRVTATD